MNPALTLTQVSKNYAQKTVLKDLNLVVPAQQTVALVGENGAGKTTLIKCLLDFTDIDQGSIHIFGQDHRLPKSREELAYLPERFIPPSFATGYDFLNYMQQLHDHDYAPEKLAALLAILDLDSSALKQPVQQLSKGMAQKIGLAATLLSGKQLLILDEPMSGLDPKVRINLKTVLTDWQAQGHSLFFSTHLLADVSALCDQLIVLHAGVIQFQGSPTAFCQTYNTVDIEQAYLRCITE